MRPLAERMRPNAIDDYIGQQKLVGEKGVLRAAIESGRIPSMILWGPPGVGKTTLARILASSLERPFHTLSAVNSGVKDVREAIEKAGRQHFFDSPSPILFIDEIHRFSKSQQDSLLGAVEDGTITLIGATTENPSFEVISALLSRCQVYILEPLRKEDLLQMVDRALQEDEYLRERDIEVASHKALLHYSGGDGRKLYNLLELLAGLPAEEDKLIITDELVEESLQENLLRYDKGGEQHYDMISAFIKSIRGSDPNAALYWLARMLAGGEDIKFIGRRIIISASEDIGLANPNALLMATTCFQAIQAIGMPEARIILAQAVVYLAASPKSNSAYMGIKQAEKLVKETGNLPVPLSLRNAPTQLMKDLAYGTGYQYAHDHPGAFVDAEFMPEEVSGTKLYQPKNNAAESKNSSWLSQWGKKYGYGT